MAPLEHSWDTVESELLMDELVKGCDIIDMRNPKELGGFVTGVAARLSELIGVPISREDVVLESMKLEQRFHRFHRYITETIGVDYAPKMNKVQICGNFYDHIKTETREQATLWREGEPRYVDLHRVYVEQRGGGGQWKWLLKAFRRGQASWMTEEVPEWLLEQKGTGGAPRRGRRC